MQSSFWGLRYPFHDITLFVSRCYSFKRGIPRKRSPVFLLLPRPFFRPASGILLIHPARKKTPSSCSKTSKNMQSSSELYLSRRTLLRNVLDLAVGEAARRRLEPLLLLMVRRPEPALLAGKLSLRGGWRWELVVGVVVVVLL